MQVKKFNKFLKKKTKTGEKIAKVNAYEKSALDKKYDKGMKEGSKKEEMVDKKMVKKMKSTKMKGAY